MLKHHLITVQKMKIEILNKASAVKAKYLNRNYTILACLIYKYPKAKITQVLLRWCYQVFSTYTFATAMQC